VDTILLLRDEYLGNSVQLIQNILLDAYTYYSIIITKYTLSEITLYRFMNQIISS